MKKQVKSVLLSALVYPGTGHFFLKKYVLSVIFSCAFSVPLYYIFREIIAKAEHVVEKIRTGEIPLDIAAISESITNSTVGSDPQELNIKMYVLVIIWVLGIIDSYRLGCKKT